MQNVSLESYISVWWCCLNTQLTHKSKNHHDINLVTLNVFGSTATTENYIFASLLALIVKQYILNSYKSHYDQVAY